jgi:hypothetical protein
MSREVSSKSCHLGSIIIVTTLIAGDGDNSICEACITLAVARIAEARGR